MVLARHSATAPPHLGVGLSVLAGTAPRLNAKREKSSFGYASAHGTFSTPNSNICLPMFFTRFLSGSRQSSCLYVHDIMG